MKKSYFTFLIILIIFSFSGCKTQSSHSDNFINVYSWGEFISGGRDGGMNVNEKFTQETGIKVNYKTFQNNEELFAKLLGGSADYDVVIPSDYMISKLIENNMLEKLDFSNIGNFKLIDNRFKNLNFDPKNEYSVPYMWGMVGIFYNEKEVFEKEITWDILWNEKYKNKILMFDNARDSFAISLLRLGYSVNTTNEEEWKKAAKELLKQKPLVQAYVMDQIFDKMANREAFLAPYYAGDAVTLMKSNENIKFVIPKSGTTKFVDSMCVPKGCKHKENAEKYINFMCSTPVAFENLKQTGYSTPQKEVYENLDEETKNNKIYYPAQEVMDNSQIFVNLPKEINSLMDKLWIEVKAGGASEHPQTLGIILLGFLFFYIAVLGTKKIANKRQQKK